ncbi:MAG TPA: DUF2917 domain-containing protein [Terrimicrobiaceae bacterium]
MHQSVLFHQQRPVGSLGDCGGNSFAAGFDESQFTIPTGAPRTAPHRSEGWVQRIARVLVPAKREEISFEPSAGRRIHQLSKGWAKRIELADGGTISCYAGSVWITLDEGGEDIVLTASERRTFGPGARVLIEALAASRVSVEAL